MSTLLLLGGDWTSGSPPGGEAEGTSLLGGGGNPRSPLSLNWHYGEEASLPSGKDESRGSSLSLCWWEWWWGHSFSCDAGWSRAVFIETFLSCYIAPFPGSLTRESSLVWGSFCDNWHSGLPVTTALSPVYMGLKENSGKSLLWQSSASEVPSQFALSLQLTVFLSLFYI